MKMNSLPSRGCRQSAGRATHAADSPFSSGFVYFDHARIRRHLQHLDSRIEGQWVAFQHHRHVLYSFDPNPFAKREKTAMEMKPVIDSLLPDRNRTH
jgi:hypothetical protein